MKNIFALDDSQNLYKAESSGGINGANWNSVLAIANDSCIPCHGSDGYNKPEVWRGLKTKILKRVKPETKREVWAMPPWETNFGKTFSDQKRQIIATWLEKEEEGAGQGFGKGNDEEKVPISGALATIAETYCLACHAGVAKHEDWWRSKRSGTNGIIDRVTRDDMPRSGGPLPPEKKTELFNLINAL